MQKNSVFLLQDTKELNETLTKKFTEDGFSVVGQATDGIMAIGMIADLKPKVLITELVLSGYDGYCVIEKVREFDKNIKIIILSALCNDTVIAKANKLGVNYFMAKPYNYTALKDRIEDLTGEQIEMNNATALVTKQTQISLDEKISKIFINIGIPPHIKGYSFLREGVKIAVNTPEVINNITKCLYPMIGEKFETTPSKVERAIRHAIEVAWNRGRIDNINHIFGVRAYVGGEKPTNGEFIALMADKMLLEQA